MTETARSPWRLGLLVAGLCVALAALFVILNRPGHGWTALPFHDFVEYWAAGRLIVAGEDPYDHERMQELESQAGRSDEGILMWNPPWVLPLVAPLGLLDVRAAHMLWMLLNLGVIVLCADLLWRLYGGKESARIMSLILAFTFMPTWFAILAGQISPLLLLGAGAFLAFVRRGNDFAAGAATVLLAIKPHLAYLFWLALLFWAVNQRRWRVLLGGALTGLALTAIAIALDPGVLGQYWHTFTNAPPAHYRSPTLGTLIRLAVGDGTFRWQFLPMLPGGVWLIVHWRRHRQAWEWGEQMPMLLLVGMLTAAYGAWPFDLVLLLLPVVAAAAELSRNGLTQARSATDGFFRRLCLGIVSTLPGNRIAAVGMHLFINGLALMLLAQEAEYLAFVWMTPALLTAYLTCMRRAGSVSDRRERPSHAWSPPPVADAPGSPEFPGASGCHPALAPFPPSGI
jgi:hypothetical protein